MANDKDYLKYVGDLDPEDLTDVDDFTDKEINYKEKVTKILKKKKKRFDDGTTSRKPKTK